MASLGGKELTGGGLIIRTELIYIYNNIVYYYIPVYNCTVRNFVSRSLSATCIYM